MTAKRFTVGNYDEGVKLTDNVECEHYFWINKYDCDDLCDLLNELYEEKEMWKRECNRLKGLYYLENENVELKKELLK